MSLTDRARIRRFNRAVTAEVGALDASYLGRGRPLGVARVLCAILADGSEIGDLRQGLKLDSGLLSRLLRRLESEGLVTVAPDPADRRRRIVRRTAAGQDEAAAYDALSDARAAEMLSTLGSGGEALLEAMDRIAVILNRDRIRIVVTDPGADTAQACLAAYFAELSRRFDGGFDPGRADADLSGYRPPRGCFLVADCDGLPVGCVALLGDGSEVAEVKRLWIAPAARGLGLAGMLMTSLEARAAALGVTMLRLDTNKALTEAIAFYRRRGWSETPRYNDNPYAQAWFAKRLAPEVVAATGNTG